MSEQGELAVLLDGLAAALGGQAASAQVRSIAATAACEGPRGPYTTEVRSARGGRLWFRQSWPDRAPFVAVVNGPHAWQHDEASGALAALDRVVVAMVRSHEFQLLPLELAQRFEALEPGGRAPFAGAACHVLRMRDELGLPCQAFLRADDGLLAGLRMADGRRGGEAQVTVDFRSWDWVAGVRMPVEVVASDAGGDYTLRFHTVELNGVDEALFAVPVEVSASTS